MKLLKMQKNSIKKNFNCLLPGVPIAIKDLFCTKDVKTTAGSKILKILFQHMNLVSLIIFGLKELFCLENLIVMNLQWVLQTKQVFLEM